MLGTRILQKAKVTGTKSKKQSLRLWYNNEKNHFISNPWFLDHAFWLEKRRHYKLSPFKNTSEFIDQ
jgi:hypothetical protein